MNGILGEVDTIAVIMGILPLTDIGEHASWGYWGGFRSTKNVQ